MGFESALSTLFGVVAVLMFITIPLGLWKLFELLQWLFLHIHIG